MTGCLLHGERRANYGLEEKMKLYGKCPECSNPGSYYGFSSIENDDYGPFIEVVASCHQCNHSWTDIYRYEQRIDHGDYECKTSLEPST